jgi:hypothetical protein
MRMAVARTPILGLSAAAAAMAGGTAMAAEWTIAPSARLTMQTQDNPRLTVVDEDKDTEISAGAVATVEVRRRTEQLQLIANSRATYQRYQRDADLDRNEQFVDVTANWQGELVSWNGDLSAARDSTTTSELGTTGLTQFNERHESLVASLGPAWQLSERMAVGANLGWQVSKYPDTVAGLSDYRYTTASVNAVYGWSDRASVTLIGSAGRLVRDAFDSESKSSSLRAQIQYALSPLWTFSAGIGPSWVETSRQRDRGFVYNASIGRRLEFSSLTLAASRSQSPSGYGVLTELDDFALAFGTQLSERVSAGLSAGLARRKDAVPAFGVDLQEVRYRQIKANLSWLFARNWQVAMSVGNYAQRLSSLSDRTARNYEAGLTLSWSGDSHVY